MNTRVRDSLRMGRGIAAGVCLAVFLTVLSSPVARAKTSGPVSFFSGNGLPIDSHNPLVVRPSASCCSCTASGASGPSLDRLGLKRRPRYRYQQLEQRHSHRCSGEADEDVG